MSLTSRNAFFHLLQQVIGEDEVGEQLVSGGHDVLAFPAPFQVALVYEYYRLANTHYGVHVVGVDNGGDVILLGDAVEKVVDYERCLGVET